MRKELNQGDQMTFPGLSQLVQVGELLVLSGQTAMDEYGEIVGVEDPIAQANQCFENIERLLRMTNSSMDDVVRLTCYLTDKAYYPAYSQAKLRFLGTNAPAGTAVVVRSLLDDRFCLEVEATAVISRSIV